MSPLDHAKPARAFLVVAFLGVFLIGSFVLRALSETAHKFAGLTP